jgi:signal transduction histidine kinase
VTSNRLERLFLYHLWACVPFGVAWIIWPGITGTPLDQHDIDNMRLVTIVAALYLLVRSWLAFRPAGKRRAIREGIIWPLTDVLLIGTALFMTPKGSDHTWLLLLYLLPITQAAATLNLRWALLIGGLAVATFVTASFTATQWGKIDSPHYFDAAFRIFFLLLMASLFTNLGREVAQARKELALAEYKRELAGEMHDGIQQFLAGVWTRLELAQRMIPNDPVKAAEIAADQRFVVRQAADELRILVRRLRSPLLEKEAFMEALRHQVALFGERTNVSAELHVSGTPHQLKPTTEHALLRIVQEAFTNITKHAGATEVSVDVEFGANEVRCVIHDNGAGFDPSTPKEHLDGLSGYGMETMCQRAAATGGTCEVQSKPGEGTSVIVTVPYVASK